MEHNKLFWRLSSTRLPACLALRFLPAASFAFLSFFSSSELEASLSDSYSSTTCQPSLYLSAILISFCLLWINFLPSLTRVEILSPASCLDVGCLNLVEYLVQFSVQLKLFLISLNFNSTISLSIFCLVPICFPLTSSWVDKKSLKRPKTCWTNRDYQVIEQTDPLLCR